MVSNAAASPKCTTASILKAGIDDKIKAILLVYGSWGWGGDVSLEGKYVPALKFVLCVNTFPFLQPVDVVLLLAWCFRVW